MNKYIFFSLFLLGLAFGLAKIPDASQRVPASVGILESNESALAPVVDASIKHSR